MRVLAVSLLVLPLCGQAVTTVVEVAKTFSISADEVKLDALREARAQALDKLPKLIVQEEHLVNDEYMSKVTGITPAFITVVSTAEHVDVLAKKYVLKATFELNEKKALGAIKEIREASDANEKLERIYKSLDSKADKLSFKSPQRWKSELKELEFSSDTFLRGTPEDAAKIRLRFIERIASQVGAATLPQYLSGTTLKLLDESDTGFTLQVSLPADYSKVVHKPLQVLLAEKTGVSQPGVNYVYPCLVEYVAGFGDGDFSVAGLYDLSDPVALTSVPSKYAHMRLSVVGEKVLLVGDFKRLPMEISQGTAPVPSKRTDSFRNMTESLDRYVKIKPCFKTHEAFKLYQQSTL